MVEQLNEIFKSNDIMVRIGAGWFKLEEIESEGTNPAIFVSDEDGEEHEFNLVDIEEFDPMVMLLQEMDKHIIGIA